MSPQGSWWDRSSPRGAVFAFGKQRGLLEGADPHSEQGMSCRVSSDPVRHVPKGPRAPGGCSAALLRGQDWRGSLARPCSEDPSLGRCHVALHR